jgi:hypothetical protein
MGHFSLWPVLMLISQAQTYVPLEKRNRSTDYCKEVGLNLNTGKTKHLLISATNMHMKIII